MASFMSANFFQVKMYRNSRQYFISLIGECIFRIISELLNTFEACNIRVTFLFQYHVNIVTK